MSTQGESYASKDIASVSFSVIVVVPSGSDQLLTAGWGSWRCPPQESPEILTKRPHSDLLVALSTSNGHMVTF